MNVENVKVYGLENSFRVSKFPYAINTDKCTEEYTDRIKSLAKAKAGSGHDNFLNGIIVQFDLTFSNKAWVEAERYHFFDFVSSQSTMHSITKMDIKSQCNEYVSDVIISELTKIVGEYNENKSEQNFLRVVYNIPSGFELKAGMTTNYRQLKTIYEQRRHHALPDWKEFCKWIETLPYSELITGEE